MKRRMERDNPLHRLPLRYLAGRATRRRQAEGRHARPGAADQDAIPVGGCARRRRGRPATHRWAAAF